MRRLSLPLYVANCATYRQFPQSKLSATTTATSRKVAASEYLSSLNTGTTDMGTAQCVAAFPALVHVFTHIRLTMHVIHFAVSYDDIDEANINDESPARRWVETSSMSEQTLSTGMRKCWDLVSKMG
jgi:A/G-specific adenine glycosylase